MQERPWKNDYVTVVRGIMRNVGFDPFIDVWSGVDGKGWNYQDCEVLVRINKQSSHIAGGVHVGKDDFDADAGGQDVMFGYASDETEDAMPLTHSMATPLARNLNDVPKSGALWWSRREHVGKEGLDSLESSVGSWAPGHGARCSSCESCLASALMRHSDAVRKVREAECSSAEGTLAQQAQLHGGGLDCLVFSCSWATGYGARYFLYESCFAPALVRHSDAAREADALVVRWRKSWLAAARMECTEKAIDGSGVVDQDKAESVLLFLAGWETICWRRRGTRRGGRAKKGLCGCCEVPWHILDHVRR